MRWCWRVGALAMLSDHTGLAFSPAVTVVGVSTPVTVRVTNPHGVRSLAAYRGAGRRAHRGYCAERAGHAFFWQRHEAERTVTFEAGKNKVPQLKEGKARLVVEAVSNDFSGSADSVRCDVTVVLAPPRVSADGQQHYINQGGMELVTTDNSGARGGVRRARWAVHLSQLSASGQAAPTSGSPCSRIPGTWSRAPCPWSSRATWRAPRLPRSSGAA